MWVAGAPGWLSWLSISDFSSGHDLIIREFKPCVGLCADSSEPGACFRFCVSLCLCSSPAHTLSLLPSKIKINIKKKNLRIDITQKKIHKWLRSTRSPSPVLRAMLIKTTMKYYPTRIRMTQLKRLSIPSVVRLGRCWRS